MIDEAVQIAVQLAARWEGFRSVPYLCPAGVPTKGFGFTHNADGSRVQLTDEPMTRRAAEWRLEALIREQYMPQVMRLCPNIDTPGRLAAITDFQFNTGALKTSTLRKKILADDWDEVPTQLRRWTRGGGKVLRGLVLRREAEIAFI